MNLTLRPGFVYILFSKNRPRDVKIGKAESVEARAFELSLGDPDLEIHAKAFFLDVFAAEAHLHSVFAEQRIDREHFKVSRTAATRELERLFDACRSQRETLNSLCCMMADMGELKLDRSVQVSECDGSALSTLMAHVPSAKDGRNVKSLIPLALSGGVLADKAARLLRSCGLLPYPVEGMVLLDKSKRSQLDRVFKGKRCEQTWRAQFAKFAGLNVSGRAVNIDVWLDSTEAGSELVDLVSPLAYAD